ALASDRAGDDQYDRRVGREVGIEIQRGTEIGAALLSMELAIDEDGIGLYQASVLEGLRRGEGAQHGVAICGEHTLERAGEPLVAAGYQGQRRMLGHGRVVAGIWPELLDRPPF